MTRFTATFTILVLVLLSSTGCWSKVSRWKFSNMLELDKGMPWEVDEEEVREGTPVRMVSSWVDTVKHTQGEMPKRGFGGRLLFYDDESNDPIKVDGELVVYAFDEANRDPVDNRPTRRFVFPAEQISLHMSKSTIGPSYSFFLPWDQVGGPQAEISLICRFKPVAGPIVVSEQTRHLLPGVIQPGVPASKETSSQSAQAKTEQPMYKQLVYEASGDQRLEQASHQETAAPERRMTTTSIPLPNSFRMPGSSSDVPAGVSSGVPELSTQPQSSVAPIQPHTSQIPPIQGPTAAKSASYRQAAAFSAQFTGQPAAPIGTSSMGPRITSPFTPIGQVALAQPQITNPLAAQTSPTIQPLGSAGSIAASVSPTTPLPPVSQSPSMSQSPVVAQSLQPNPAAAAAIPPAYVSPQARQQLTAEPGATTTRVSYLSRAETLAWERGQRSFGSQPSSPQAPSQPAVR